MIDAASITLVQNTFLVGVSNAFSTVAQYALNLLYIFVVLEIVLFGLLWAIQQDAQWGRLLFKILKIGLIFFFIQNFSYLIGVVVQSFADIAGIVTQTPNLSNAIFNPAHLWLYGYNAAVLVLKAASASGSVGLALTQVIIGFGILLSFTVLGIQIVLQVVGFYLISLLGMLLVPLGVFSATNMVENVIQQILKAGIRVAVLTMVVGVAIIVWHALKVTQMSSSLSFNTSLGLFVSALLFAYLAVRLPGLVAKVVGKFDFSKVAPTASATVQAVEIASNMGASEAHNISAASNVGAATMMPAQQFASTPAASQMIPTVNVMTAAGASQLSSDKRKGSTANLADANMITKSVSDELLKTMQKSINRAIKGK